MAVVVQRMEIWKLQSCTPLQISFLGFNEAVKLCLKWCKNAFQTTNMQIDAISGYKIDTWEVLVLLWHPLYVFLSTVLFLWGLNTCHNKCVPFINLYGQRINQAKYSSFMSLLPYFLNNKVVWNLWSRKSSLILVGDKSKRDQTSLIYY